MQKFNFPGDIHFVTFKTYNNHHFFKDESCCELFLRILNNLRDKLKFDVLGYCILLEHIHLLLHLWVAANSFAARNRATNEFVVTQKEEDISYVIKRIKGMSASEINQYFSRQGSHALPERSQGAGALATPRRRIKIWQSSFYDFNIYSLKKFNEKLNYIHKNPIKHGLVDDVSKYKYCSWRNYELNDHSVFKIDFLEF